MTTNRDPIWDIVDTKSGHYTALSNQVWDAPELNYQEFEAARLHEAVLQREGFAVTAGVAGIPTAMIGEAGSGGPVIAILGEYDALPGLSQEAGVAVETPLVRGGSGHGCGHNMLGSASLLAAAAVKEWLAANGLPGRVRYYGCPAEEGGSAKGFMVRDGAFDDVDIAISWHPAAFTSVSEPASLACVESEFTFIGRAAHAAAAPELGRSALDAVELMSVGVNYMREHMPSSARVHYAVVDGGGIAPNVVQPRAVVRHLVRGATLDDMWTLFERVKKIAQGAALMTETSVTVQQLSGEANLVGNAVLEGAMHESLLALGSPGFDDADRRFAAEIQKSLTHADIVASYAPFGLAPQGEALADGVQTIDQNGKRSLGSTDVGTVSWTVPTVQCRVACYAVGTPGHSWQLVAQGKSPAAHKGLAHAAKAMAGVAGKLFADPQLLAAARSEFAEFRAANAFRNPVGPELRPPLTMGG